MQYFLRVLWIDVGQMRWNLMAQLAIGNRFVSNGYIS